MAIYSKDKKKRGILFSKAIIFLSLLQLLIFQKDWVGYLVHKNDCKIIDATVMEKRIENDKGGLEYSIIQFQENGIDREVRLLTDIRDQTGFTTQVGILPSGTIVRLHMVVVSFCIGYVGIVLGIILLLYYFYIMETDEPNNGDFSGMYFVIGGYKISAALVSVAMALLIIIFAVIMRKI